MGRKLVAVLLAWILSGTAIVYAQNCDWINIAKESDLHPALVDGIKGCACVNNASFGPGWNPGEVIEVNFPEVRNIKAVGLYLGCSTVHGETGSGYIEAKVDGKYKIIATFDDYGYKTNRFLVKFDRIVNTNSLRIHMTAGGGSDKNLCVSEVEIYESKEYKEGFEAGKLWCRKHPKECKIKCRLVVDPDSIRCKINAYQDNYKKHSK